MNKHYTLPLSSFISVVIIFHVSYGLEVIIPTNISWLMTAMHDWGTHYLGWYFFRGEEWQFPIGNITKYNYPLSTNIGFTDSIPLLAILFKTIAPLLSEDFQYFGLWLFICHTLVAYFTIKLLRLFEIKPLYIFAAVVFIAANPVLVYRGIHPALAAHWLIIAAIYVYFLDPKLVKTSRILLYQLILLVLSALINPYMCFMVLGFTFFTALRLCFFDRELSIPKFFGYQASSLAMLLASWYLVGMITFDQKEDLGVGGAYGLYSLNLNSLYNSFGFSSLFPRLEWVSWHQYEGYMYLGAGAFLLIIGALLFAFYGLVFSKNQRETSVKINFNGINSVPLFVLAVLYTLFSITHVVSLNEKVLFTAAIPHQLIKVGEIFRASSRFFWTPYYLILFFTIVAFAKIEIKELFKTGVLFAALLIQLYDIRPLLTHRQLTYGSYTPPINVRHWEELISHFDEIVLYPPYQASYLSQLDYQFFCYLAAKARKPITTGYVPRVDTRKLALVTDSLSQAFKKGILHPNTLYITTDEHLKAFSLVLQTRKAQLNILDNYYYLIDESSENDHVLTLAEKLNHKDWEKLNQSLAQVGTRTLFEKVENRTNKRDSDLNYSIDNLQVKTGYISIDGWAIAEETNNNKGDSIYILLQSANKTYQARTRIHSRPDVTAHFNKTYLDDAGFSDILFTDKVEKGNYTLGIKIITKSGDWRYSKSDRIIKVGYSEFSEALFYAKPFPKAEINYQLDSFNNNNEIINVSGWAHFAGHSTYNQEIKLVLQNANGSYLYETEPIQRPDVTAHFTNKYNLDGSGFNCKLRKSSLPKGDYKVGIYISDSKLDKEGLVMTDISVIN